MPDPIRIVIPIYDGVTHLDFTGPQQFFARAELAETIVASVGPADTTMTPAATRPPSAASHLRCEYLVMHVLPDRKSPRDGVSAITTRRPPDD